jgi:hypothetical protein
MIDPDRPLCWKANPFDFGQALQLRAIDRARPRRLVASLEWPAPAPKLLAELSDAEFDAMLAQLDDTFEAGRDAETDYHAQLDREQAHDWPAPIRSRWVQKTRKPHYCDRCHGDLRPGDRARVDTIKTDRGVTSVYICEACEFPKPGECTAADTCGTKLYDEAEGTTGFAPDGTTDTGRTSFPGGF